MLQLVVFLLTLVGGYAEPASAAGPPNILLILTDDQGWSQTAIAMDPRVPESRSTYLETPNMSRLAREGMRFTSGYSPAPLCTPTRRAILCGTSTARSGTEFKSPWVPADHLTIPKALKQANPAYRCAHFGKWGERDNTPASRALCRVGVAPRETDHDLSAKEPGKAAALEQTLLDFLKSVNAETVPPSPRKKGRK